MNDLLLNDTFENFNFTANVNVFNTFADVNLKCLSQKSAIKSDTKLKNISFDDSIFLSQISFSENENGKSDENESVSTKLQSGNRLCVEEESENKENLCVENVSDKSECDNEVNKSKSVQNKLSFWGLPENVLQKYESKKLTTMFPWQVECLKQNGVLTGRNLVYSAPTSAGKTLVAEILAIKTILESKKKVIFILPFVSIVREKMYYFQNLLETSGIRVDGFMGSYNPPGGFGAVQLAICTIEKANSLINRLLQEGRLSEIGAVLIDEMHLLGDPSRGYLLELLLTKLKYASKKDNLSIQIIGMSATLPNLKQIATWLDAELYTTDYRPVPLNERAQVCGEIYDANMTLVRKLNLLNELTTDSDNVLQLCLETIKESRSVLIFCPTKNWCENLAQQIATGFFKIGSSTGDWSDLLRSQLDTNLIIELLEQLKYCPVGLDEILRKTVSFGVAFHHAGLTMDERDIVEGAFRNGALRVLVATSTLSSGVNLPARRVIIRTPIFHGKPLDCLVYRQMIGRAGRMGRDTVGESFLICQKNDFKIAKTLMSAALTPVKSCLETAGKLKRAVLEVVASGVASTPLDVRAFTESTLLAFEDGGLALNNPVDEAVAFLQLNEFIRLQKSEDGGETYAATSLGKACLSSSIAPDEGLSLFTELEKARQCLVLETELHLVYLVTPYSACYSWTNIDWMLYLNLWEKLPANMKKVGELVGIREVYIINAARNKVESSTGTAFHKYLAHKRFFVALALQDLVDEKPLAWVCRKFNCNRGMLQSLQQSAASFAGMVTAFSKQLGWTSLELLLAQFQDRMQFGVGRDLLDLMHLAVMNGKMARSLYDAGIETVVRLANSDVGDIENVLHRAVPFESDKIREGESDFDKRQRNKYRNVWITGREGLTEREAAEIFVTEARRYLQIEMGLVDAKWKDAADRVRELDVKFAGNIDSNRNESIPTKIDVEPQNDDKVTVDTFLSDDSSMFSINMNISDASSVSNTDSTKIDDDFDFVKETPNKLSEKLEKCTLDSPKRVATTDRRDKKTVNNFIKDISMSDFSDTLSENSSNAPSSKRTVNDVSGSIKSSVIEPNASGTSQRTSSNVSLDRMQSDQSLFDDSFSLQLTDNDSSTNAFQHSDDDVLCESIDESYESVRLSAKKRKHGGSDENDSRKKFKNREFVSARDTNANKLERRSGTNFAEMESVNVCRNSTLFEAFSKEIRELDGFSFSIACSKFVEFKPTIGMNLQGPKLRNADDKRNRFSGDGRTIEGFSFCWESNVAYYLSLVDAKWHRKILKLLKIVFENPQVRVGMFDAKEQIKVLERCCGVGFCSKVIDPKIADWILEPEGKEKNLKAMVVKYCPEGIGLSRLSGGCKGVGSVGLDIYSAVDAKIRSSLEAILTHHLTETLNRTLFDENPKYLTAYEIENGIIPILSKTELTGFGLNRTVLKNLLTDLKTEINVVEKTAFSLAGRNFNFASSADVAKVTGMSNGRKISTRKQILEKKQHPVSELVLRWRKLHSVLTKTVYPLIRSDSIDRIRGRYITHTSTGRISMHEPNLQNINKDFDVSTKGTVSISCRNAFEAPDGCELVSADYCQLELRILTHFSQDASLRRIMSEPGDVFKMVAAKWNNIEERQVTDSVRQNAKHLCYGIIYGMGSKTLADQLDMQETEAVAFMETFRNTYSGIKTFIKRTIDDCKQSGYVETINGRKRFLPHINDTDPTRKGQAERQAVNTIIQGSAADIVKAAMIKVDDELDRVFRKTKSKPKMVLHLHDELIYEVPSKYLRKVSKIVKRNMEESIGMSVPFPVKLKAGKSWGTMREFSL